MRKFLILILALFLAAGFVFADITFTGDVSVDFDENSTVVFDQNRTGDVTLISGVTHSGWDFDALFLHYDRGLDILYLGLDFDDYICGDADGDSDPAHTSTALSNAGGEDVADLGDGETVCIYINTDLDCDYDVICGIPRYQSYADFVAANCSGNPNNDPSNSFGTAIASASGSYAYMNPDAGHPDFECIIDNFSELPGFNFDPESDDVVFRVGAYAGSWADDGIGRDILYSSQRTVTFFNPTTIPHSMPNDLYVMQGIPVFVDNGDPTVCFGPPFSTTPPGQPNWRVSRWNTQLQTYERWGEPINWPINVGGDPPEQDPGKGFWVVQDVLDSCQFEIIGFTLNPGWLVFQNLVKPNPGVYRGINMMANPFELSVDWSDYKIRLQSGGNDISITSAVNDGLMCRYAVAWDPYGLEYIPHDLGSTLEIWAGFWVEQYNAVNDYELRIAYPSSDNVPTVIKSGGTAPSALDEYGEWYFSIGVRHNINNQVDFGNFLGEISDASDQWDSYDAREYMPQADKFVHLFFPHQDWPEKSDNYSYDFRTGPHTGAKVWDISVRADGDAGNVFNAAMSWDGIAKVPEEYDIYLFDEFENLVVPDMRAQDEYSFPISNGEELRFYLWVSDLGTTVEHVEFSAPKEFSLSSAYPNPFNPSTSVKLDVPHSSWLKLAVFDINGRLVKTIANEYVNQGVYTFNIDLSGQASGVYFLKAQTDDRVIAVKKIALMK
ncbi:T9SS type A sorting domain-containing protein [bacterium]|nr:T9SS type A sorting domain-containing protein [FCB group bacterium]MBL7192264.1 T9SS type A sorting domain-containing protein [bacterium]